MPAPLFASIDDYDYYCRADVEVRFHLEYGVTRDGKDMGFHTTLLSREGCFGVDVR